jgi:NADH dehydrogenase FAD-containing subunit
VSGQELGVRLSRPNDWARDYWIPFDRFRGLGRVRIVHGTLTGLDLATRTVFARHDDGSPLTEEYAALVISTGVTNGFWRRPTFQSAADIGIDLRAAHDRLAAARSVSVVGGGAAAVSSAANLATAWPDKRVELYFPERALPQHHPRIWGRVRRRLTDAGVVLHRGTGPWCQTGSRAIRSPASRSGGAPGSRRRAPMPCSGR